MSTQPVTTTAPAPSAAPSAASSTRALVVIPALEPGAELVPLVTALVADGIDVLVVDDGSGPQWSVVFDRCAVAGARVHHLVRNRGKGAALRAAFDLVRDQYSGRGAVTADADGQHTPEDIRRVRDVLDGAGDDGGTSWGGATGAPGIVLGVRSFAAGEVPLRSRLGNAVSAAVLGLATGVALGDTQTGLRGIPSAHLEWAGELPGDRYEYEYTMLARAPRDGIPLRQVPIATVYLDENVASHFRPVRDSLRVLGPVLAFSLSGLLAFAVDTALFALFLAVGAEVWIALAGARLLSGTLNFLANRRVVFVGGRTPPLRRAALQYAALAAVVLAGGEILVDLLVGVGAPALAAKIASDLALFGLSYVVQRLIVFRGGRR